jgi:hypothetical protein
MLLEGMPEGVELIRYGSIGAEDYVFWEGAIYNSSTDAVAGAGFIVQPAPGWEFWLDVRLGHRVARRKRTEPRSYTIRLVTGYHSTDIIDALVGMTATGEVSVIPTEMVQYADGAKEALSAINKPQ